MTRFCFLLRSYITIRYCSSSRSKPGTSIVCNRAEGNHGKSHCLLEDPRGGALCNFFVLVSSRPGAAPPPRLIALGTLDAISPFRDNGQGWSGEVGLQPSRVAWVYFLLPCQVPGGTNPVAPCELTSLDTTSCASLFPQARATTTTERYLYLLWDYTCAGPQPDARRIRNGMEGRRKYLLEIKGRKASHTYSPAQQPTLRSTSC